MSPHQAKVCIALLIGSIFASSSAVAGIDETYIRPSGSNRVVEAIWRIFGRESFGKSYALVIGVGDYDHRLVRKLSAPAADATRVRDFLREQAGFDHIVTLTDEKATRGRIEELMEGVFPATVKQSDRFLFYFSGHGQTRQLATTKRGYLMLKQAGPQDWHAMIDMPRVRQWTENLGEARHALFLLDACFSGLAAWEPKSTPAQKTIQRLMQPGHHIITAGTEGEESFIFGGESLFTQAFLSAAGGDGNLSPDGIVSLNEMMVYINRMLDAKRAEVGERIKMTPRMYYSRIANNAGEFFFLPLGAPRLADPSVRRTPRENPSTESKAAGEYFAAVAAYFQTTSRSKPEQDAKNAAKKLKPEIKDGLRVEIYAGGDRHYVTISGPSAASQADEFVTLAKKRQVGSSVPGQGPWRLDSSDFLGWKKIADCNEARCTWLEARQQTKPRPIDVFERGVQPFGGEPITQSPRR